MAKLLKLSFGAVLLGLLVAASWSAVKTVDHVTYRASNELRDFENQLIAEALRRTMQP